jgi:ABC-type phosphate transport system permease subunit
MIACTPIQPGADYGILFLCVGTLLSTLVALALALPVGVSAAIFLAEAVDARLRTWISLCRYRAGRESNNGRAGERCC